MSLRYRPLPSKLYLPFSAPTPLVQNVPAVQIVQAVRKFVLKHLDSSDVLNVLNYLNYLNAQASMPALSATMIRQIFRQPFVPGAVDFMNRARLRIGATSIFVD